MTPSGYPADIDIQKLSAIVTCCKCGHSLARPDIEIPTSPFDHLQHDNGSVDGARIKAMSDSIALSHTHISALDDDIHRLEAALTELRRKRDGLASYAEVNQGLMSPFWWIPRDIQVEIFMYFVADWGSDAKCSIKSGPLALTGVCRRWRDTAIETPLLWSSIPIVLGDGSNGYCSWDSKDRAVISLLTTWLKRAQACPLSITLRTRGSISLNDDNLPPDKIMDPLIKSSPRWRSIFLQVTPALHERLTLVKQSLPNLQNISLSIITLPPTLDLFEHAPHTSSLTYVGNSADDDVPLFSQPLRWEQLRHLDCNDNLLVDQWLGILPRIPNLETATLHVSLSISSRTHTKDGSIHLMNLHGLVIFADSFDAPNALLNSLCAPALTSFEVAVKSHDEPNCAPAILSFLSQAPHLHKLTLHFPLWSPGSSPLVTLLQTKTELKELNLHGCNAETISADFLDAFVMSTEPTPSTTLVPVLASISMSDSYGPEVNMSALINALKSRASRGLRDVLISRTDSWTSAFSSIHHTLLASAGDLPSDVRQLGELRDRLGVNVRVLVEGKDIYASGSS